MGLEDKIGRAFSSRRSRRAVLTTAGSLIAIPFLDACQRPVAGLSDAPVPAIPTFTPTTETKSPFERLVVEPVVKKAAELGGHETSTPYPAVLVQQETQTPSPAGSQLGDIQKTPVADTRQIITSTPVDNPQATIVAQKTEIAELRAAPTPTPAKPAPNTAIPSPRPTTRIEPTTAPAKPIAPTVKAEVRAANEVVLDQEQSIIDGIEYVHGKYEHAQGFRPSVSGYLHHIELPLSKGRNVNSSLSVAIHTDRGGEPYIPKTIAILPPESIPQTQAWTSITFPPNIQITADTSYYIGVRAPEVPSWEQGYVWGKTFGKNDKDGTKMALIDGVWKKMNDGTMAFKVYMFSSEALQKPKIASAAVERPLAPNRERYVSSDPTLPIQVDYNPSYWEVGKTPGTFLSKEVISTKNGDKLSTASIHIFNFESPHKTLQEYIDEEMNSQTMGPGWPEEELPRPSVNNHEAFVFTKKYTDTGSGRPQLSRVYGLRDKQGRFWHIALSTEQSSQEKTIPLFNEMLTTLIIHDEKPYPSNGAVIGGKAAPTAAPIPTTAPAKSSETKPKKISPKEQYDTLYKEMFNAYAQGKGIFDGELPKGFSSGGPNLTEFDGAYADFKAFVKGMGISISETTPNSNPALKDVKIGAGTVWYGVFTDEQGAKDAYNTPNKIRLGTRSDLAGFESPAFIIPGYIDTFCLTRMDNVLIGSLLETTKGDQSAKAIALLKTGVAHLKKSIGY